jgi:hypothetical protein
MQRVKVFDSNSQVQNSFTHYFVGSLETLYPSTLLTGVADANSSSSESLSLRPTQQEYLPALAPPDEVFDESTSTQISIAASERSPLSRPARIDPRWLPIGVTLPGLNGVSTHWICVVVLHPSQYASGVVVK